MRGFGTLIICLIGVAVVYGVYWFGRAVIVAKDAHAYVKETGSISDAVKCVWATQSLPDGIRLTASQFKYVDRNAALFHAECGPEITRSALKLLQRMQEANRASQDQIDESQMQQNAIMVATLGVAKDWCEQRSIA